MTAFTDTHQRILAAQRLLEGKTTSIEKFNSARELLEGINPRLDRVLNRASGALEKIESLQKREIVKLSAEVLPEVTEEEKKRKKAILFFIKSLKDLKSEVARVSAELESVKGKSLQEKAASGAKVAYFAKGAFGLITLAAVVVVGGKLLLGRNVQKTVEKAVPRQKTEVIEFDGKQIPLSQLTVGTGPDCDGDHYHAANGASAQSTDGSAVPDPGACGYGKVEETRVLEI